MYSFFFWKSNPIKLYKIIIIIIKKIAETISLCLVFVIFSSNFGFTMSCFCFRPPGFRNNIERGLAQTCAHCGIGTQVCLTKGGSDFTKGASFVQPINSISSNKFTQNNEIITDQLHYCKHVHIIPVWKRKKVRSYL